MLDPETLYDRLPTGLQDVICNVEGWRLRRNRFGGSFRDLLRDVEGRAAWPSELVIAYRDDRLRRFVKHCSNSVPFYRRLFQEQRIRADDIRTLKDLRQLPVLTKEIVQRNISDFTSNAVAQRQHVLVHTSGTTGAGLRFKTTKSAIQEQWAVWWRYRRIHGIEPGTWCGYFGGRSVVPLTQKRPPFWRTNYPGKQILFSGYHMSSENMSSYAEELRKKRPPWLHGYPSLIALLAAHLIESREDLGFQPRWITVGAENLLPHQAGLIRRAFGVQPRQHYGMAEAVANISECPEGNLHVDEDFAAVEFISDQDDNTQRVIGTNFTNLVFPLLRYDVQDTVTVSEGRCSCNRPGRMVQWIDGRLEDYVVLKNGARLGRMDHIFKDMVNVLEAQINQSRTGELLIRVVRGHGYTDSDEATLIRETRRRVGNETNLSIEYVQNLERSKRGKLRFVVSSIATAQVTGAPPLSAARQRLEDHGR